VLGLFPAILSFQNLYKHPTNDTNECSTSQ